jgi:hypothetical protein
LGFPVVAYMANTHHELLAEFLKTEFLDDPLSTFVEVFLLTRNHFPHVRCPFLFGFTEIPAARSN